MKEQQVFNDWTIRECIGKGAFGSVYHITREDFGREYEAALKIIEIPKEQAEVDVIRNEGLEEESITEYFKDIVEELVDEFALMSKLKGNSNIVSYEYHSVVPKEDSFGWNIYIRMELLKPFTSYIKEHTLTVRDVIKLGIDMCHALEVCQKYNIIHRDIKPENIFVSNIGDFKLGDFGIARQLEKTSSGLSKKGTYTYMAPEVYKGLPYNSTVDIYSLGIVLYRFLNNNRAPFLPAAPAVIHFSDREKANVMRMSGEKLPNPCNATGRLAEIVLKACAYDPKERYESAYEMRQDLQKEKEAAGSDSGEAKPVRKKQRRIAVIVSLAGILAIGAGSIVTIFRAMANDGSGLEEEYTVLDKLKISARFPKGWTVQSNEDAIYASFEKDGTEKEIRITMDYYWAAVNESGYATLGSAGEMTAADGAEDAYAQTLLEQCASSYEEGVFANILEESAIYEINGRKYYYLQYEAEEDLHVAFYYTVQDGAEIYYRLRVNNGKITEEDRILFDNVMRSVQMDADSVNYAEIRASDYIENIYKLSEEKIENQEIGIAVNMPVVCNITNEGEKIEANYEGNSYTERFRDLIDGVNPYNVQIYSEDVSAYINLENGMNQQTADILEAQYEQEKGYIITSRNYKEINGRQYLRMTTRDISGRYLFFMTMYKGTLIIVSLNSDSEYHIDSDAKKMVVSMLETMEYK